MNEEKPLKAVIYTRISIDARDSVSLEHQLESAQNYVKARGWELVGTFSDPGVSASKFSPSERRGWSRLMAHPERFDRVVIWKIDRLVRSAKDFLLTHDVLKDDRKAYLVSITESLDMSTPSGVLVATMTAMFAQMEAENTAIRVRAAKERLHRVGRAATGAPYGWTTVPGPDGVGRVYAKDPKRIKWVEAMVKRTFAGHTLYSTKKWLEEQGAPLPKNSQGRRKGRNDWSYSTIERTLRHPMLAGMTLYNPGHTPTNKERGKRVYEENGVPRVNEGIAIMSVAEWQELSDLLDNRDSPQAQPRSPEGTTSPLLAGMVWCGECDRKMYRGTVQGRESQYCPECHQVISRLNPVIAEEFLAYTHLNLRLVKIRTVRVVEDLEEEIAQLHLGVDQLSAQIGQTRGQAQMELFKRVQTLQEQIDKLESTMPQVRREPYTTDTEFYRQSWEQITGESKEADEARRELLNEVIERIIITRGRRGGPGVDRSRIEIVWRAGRRWQDLNEAERAELGRHSSWIEEYLPDDETLTEEERYAQALERARFVEFDALADGWDPADLTPEERADLALTAEQIGTEQAAERSEG